MADHHTHHDCAQANADYFSKRALSYRTELSVEIAKRCASFILKKYPFDSNKTEVLDFACGPGLIAFELLPHAKRIIGVDSAPGMVEVFNLSVEDQGISPEKLQCIKSDSLKGDQSDFNGLLFDVIICVRAYHHFEDPVHVTRVFAQHLKPKGRLMIIDFANAGNIEAYFGHLHGHSHVVPHKHGFSSEQMIDMLKAADLQNPQVEEIFTMTKSEMKHYQGYEQFARVINSNIDFTFHYFIAYGDKA
ncbi:unnamed protein product [Rotaria sordida]|uniref:Uncharacterized protein n=1 Tax=Rotaria sordida TaxID=392033 RepID=A0A814KP71_9BILA|nr:unnamed protein product [Rotaria sordida]CAF3729995.1 unnamed protein product [Rotaria sordida]